MIGWNCSVFYSIVLCKIEKKTCAYVEWFEPNQKKTMIHFHHNFIRFKIGQTKKKNFVGKFSALFVFILCLNKLNVSPVFSVLGNPYKSKPPTSLLWAQSDQ